MHKLKTETDPSDWFIKEGWTWRDIITELGIGAAIDAAVAAGAAGVAGTASGAGAMAGIGAAAGPIGWAILGGAALTMGIWYLTRQMDNNLSDLIDRLEDLDPNNIAAPKVQSWIQQLNSYKSVLELPPTTTNIQERARQNIQKYMSIKQVYEYLKQMLVEWPVVKENLTDWGWDDAQAEHALQLTTKTMGQSVEQAKVRAQQAAQETIKDLQSRTKIDYQKLAKDVDRLYTRLTEMSGGKPPTFDTDAERASWNVVQRLLGKSEGYAPLTQQEIISVTKPMQDLKLLMEHGIEMITAKASVHKAISKRALTLGDGRKVLPRDRSQSPEKQRTVPSKSRSRGDPFIRGLQLVVNQINTALNSGAGVVREDGIYGPVTADALVGAISSDWRIQQEVAERSKVGFDALQNIKMMRDRPQLLRSVYRVIAPIARNLSKQGIETGMAGLGPVRPVSQRQVMPEKPRGYKDRPIQDEELLTYRMLHDW
jgi:hypothetical protein